MIGVLAIMAIMAAVLVPRTVEAILRARGDAETANLVNFETGLRQHIRLNKNIPGNVTLPPNTWAADIAAQMGYSAAAVTTNSRGNARRYLVNPGFGVLIPYTQNPGTTGLGGAPASPRLLIVGSVGAALPLLNPITQAQFDEIWNTADGAVPATWGVWGRGSDLKIQRIQLGNVFCALNLSVPAGFVLGFAPRYDIDGTQVPPPAAYPVNAFFLSDTLVDLWDRNALGADTLSIRYRLDKGNSFMYNANLVGTPAQGGYWSR